MASCEHNLFFASRIENGAVYLDSEETRHALSVLRFSSGETLLATDGNGAFYECKIATRESNELKGEIISTTRMSRPQSPVRMFVGICDRDRFEELAESCAALGAERIIPVVCRFCQKPWWSAWDKHSQRIHKKLIAGIKQSRNPWLPVCAAPTAFADALTATEETVVLVASGGGKQFVDVLDRIKQAPALSCVVGPPGGFSPEELESLEKTGATFVSLSVNRLRTELATIVLCGAVKLAQGNGAR
jgi:16S rRNA (uracil1498-N3)-methyltransferase